jgi:mannose-6-phosphate isomerase
VTVKILDPAEWLSVQLHPDDAVARARHGPDARGKSEAWVVLEAPPGATVIAGSREGFAVTAGMSPEAVLGGMQWIPVERGTVIHLPAGTVHALGPGVVTYEIQQASNLTYRIHDWDRDDPGRPLDFLAAAEAFRHSGLVQA